MYLGSVFAYFSPHLDVSRAVIHHVVVRCHFRARVELRHIELHLVHLCCMESVQCYSIT